MRLKVKLIGSGKIEDPHRVNLPTYHMVHVDYDEGFAIVDIPSDVHGLTAEQLKAETLIPHVAGDHYETLHPALIDKIHAHLRDRYQEHRGKFKVELVK